MTLNFQSAEKYRKWRAYKAIHNIPTKHWQKVTIRGHPHAVHHVL
jgi:hypothetical protein